MTDIAFRRITPDESRVYRDGDLVGEVYRQDDVLTRGSHFYFAQLSEDPRGPVRIHERARIRGIATRLVATHPLWR